MKCAVASGPTASPRLPKLVALLHEVVPRMIVAVSQEDTEYLTTTAEAAYLRVVDALRSGGRPAPSDLFAIATLLRWYSAPPSTHRMSIYRRLLLELEDEDARKGEVHDTLLSGGWPSEVTQVVADYDTSPETTSPLLACLRMGVYNHQW